VGILATIRMEMRRGGKKARTPEVLEAPGALCELIRQHLLSHFWYYHRLRKLNYRVRNGNGCDLSDMVAGKERTGRTVRTGPLGAVVSGQSLVVSDKQLFVCLTDHWPLATLLIVGMK
jgi:hypothetical protein